MAFRRLDSIVAKVVSRLMIDGEGEAATCPEAASAKSKREPTHNQAPPQRRVGSHLSLEEAGRTDCPVYMQRASAALSPSLTPDGASAHETPPARRQAVRSLRVIDGGRPATGGGDSRAAYRASAGRERVREFLKLVV